MSEDYHDCVLSIEEKNKDPLSEAEFAQMIEEIRGILDSRGFKLESYGSIQWAIVSYGRPYLEAIKDEVEKELKRTKKLRCLVGDTMKSDIEPIEFSLNLYDPKAVYALGDLVRYGNLVYQRVGLESLIPQPIEDVRYWARIYI